MKTIVRSAAVLILLSLAVRASPVAAENHAGPDGLSERIAETLESLRAELIEVRRDLHRHPELSGEEVRTAGIVADRLESLGFEVRRNVGGHGVVAVLAGGRPGPVVGFRADMDAVRDPSPDPVPFASEAPGVRHVCGHDVHTTVGLGIAEALAAVREEIPGTVLLIFQGAEETGQGARAMLAEGALEDPRPAAMFAVHTAPMPVGSMAAGIGQALPARDMIAVAVSGDGDLDAAHQRIAAKFSSLTTVDVAAAAAGGALEEDFVLAQVFPSRPQADDGRTVVRGQLTTNSRAMADRAMADMRSWLESEEPEGLEFELELQERLLSGIYNEPTLVEATGKVIRSVLGEEAFATSTGTSPFFSEDFGFFQDEAPGVMFWLGVSNPEKGTVGLPHSPRYVADEEAIFVGAKAISAVLLAQLEGTP